MSIPSRSAATVRFFRPGVGGGSARLTFYGLAWAVRMFQSARRRRNQAAPEPAASRDQVTVDHSAEQIVPLVSQPDVDPFLLKWGFRFNPNWVLKPWSKWRFRWLIVVSLAVLYNLLIIFPRAVFEQLEQDDGGYRKAWIVLDYICDFLYVCDMFINLLTGFLDNGVIVREPRRLWAHYRASRKFKLDLLSLFPTDLCFIWTGQGKPYVILRVNRLLRMHRLNETIYRAESRADSPIFYRIAVLLAVLAIVTHINGCLYYFVSSEIGVGSDRWVYPATAMWRHENATSHIDDTMWEKWIFCTYWSAMMLTSILPNMNNPATTGEFVFHIMDILVGVLLYATIVARISGMILNISKKRDVFRGKEEGVKGYLQLHKVGSDMDSRVVKWFDYIWSTKQDLDEESVLTLLPQKLRMEIARFVHISVLQKVQLFHGVDDQFLEELVLKLKFVPFSPGDFICRKGDIGRQMYVVRRGKLNVVSDDGRKIFATLGAGTVFGELSILNIPGSRNGNRRTANVCAVGYADLFSLSKEDLWDALGEYPDVRTSLLERARHILKRDDLIDEQAAVQSMRVSRDFAKVSAQCETSLDILQQHMQRFMDDYKGAFGELNLDLQEMETQIKKMAKGRKKQPFRRKKDDRRLYSAGDIDILLEEDVVFRF
ncbi:Cyclic nucleotide-gated olfactory channel [Hypsibius exemplaris]|uniref:Cyclic nucleotide-gated olfactory channel n=1 Tax=Hypsibius exemplaris TaxID=2072580 RepID=A0A9X6NHJ9_HYPEX|nr:Cyclic nucleotide-gated olfactory channel [Hypsibius exemplaris]